MKIGDLWVVFIKAELHCSRSMVNYIYKFQRRLLNSWQHYRLVPSNTVLKHPVSPIQYFLWKKTYLTIQQLTDFCPTKYKYRPINPKLSQVVSLREDLIVIFFLRCTRQAQGSVRHCGCVLWPCCHLMGPTSQWWRLPNHTLRCRNERIWARLEKGKSFARWMQERELAL